MRNFFFTTLSGLAMICISMAAFPEELWLHPKCEKLPSEVLGPFVTLGDGGILAVQGVNALVSKDEGATWEATPIFKEGENASTSAEGVLLRTRSGVIISAFLNTKLQDWRWNSTTHDADPGTRLPCCVVRSLDDGKTWQDFQTLHEDWTGAVRNIIQTRGRRVTSMRLLRTGRALCAAYSSTVWTY